MTGQRRLAAERVPHARAAAVLRRHLLPARAAPTGCPRGRRCCRRSPSPGSERREEIRAGGERVCASASRAARGSTPSSEPITAERLDAAVARLARVVRRAPWRLRRRAEVPAGVGDRASCCCAASARWRCGRCRDGRRRASTISSAAASRATASTPPGRCRTSRRCSTTTRCSPAPTCTAGRRRGEARLLEVCLRRARLGAARDARPRGRLLLALDADSEGVEGRYYVWSVAELRDVLGEDADAAIAWFGVTQQGNFDEPHHPQPALNVLQARGPGAPAASRSRAHPRASARAARQARAARARRQAPDRAGTR